MKASDRSVLIGLVILGLLACFWFVLLAPKRDRASELGDRVADLRTEVEEQEQLAVTAEEAQADYGKNYERLVVLGKAAPADGDTPSLLTQLSALAKRSQAKFGSLTAGGEEAVAPPPPAAETTTDQNAEADSEPGDEQPVSAPPAPAQPNEAIAATLPIGASIGPAGLGVMPYTLSFSGDFFQVAKLLGGFDSQVAAGKRRAFVGGRLVTVNGFSMAPSGVADTLEVELSIATYVLPSSQGLTAGASPTGPATSVPAATPVATADTTSAP